MKSVYFGFNNLSNHQTIMDSGSGASEFQLLMLAKSLADYGFEVTCFSRSDSVRGFGKLDNIIYRDYNDLINNNRIDTNTPLIFWRFFDILPNLTHFYNIDKIILWSHDHRGHGLSKEVGEIINHNKLKIIAVSNFHKNSLTHSINPSNIIVIYNAVYNDMYYYDEYTKIDKNAVVFASAWHKGIETILLLFDKLYNYHPNFYLRLLSPNYGKIDIKNFIDKPYIQYYDTVKNKKRLCELIQSSLCTMSTEFPETFGCIFAESYFLKTPVIATHRINGMHEFIDNHHICNLKNYESFENLLMSFYKDRPKIQLSNQFLKSNVLKNWINLISTI